jgi:hypothetical protein
MYCSLLRETYFSFYFESSSGSMGAKKPERGVQTQKKEGAVAA